MESSKTGIKTIDRIAEIPVVNSALNNVTDYYGKVKEKNALLRTSFNLAEMSFKTMAIAATPITSICKKPIESVDDFLAGKLHDLEHNYPSIVKPTEQVQAIAYSQAKMIYNKTVKEPMDTLTNIREKTTDLGFRMVDACLENRLAKMFTNPMLDLTEKSLDYLLPAVPQEQQASQEMQEQQEPRTLRRLYDINNRLYGATFQQLHRLHFQFENMIQKLQSLKQMSDSMINKSFENIKSNSLVSQCVDLINKNNLSLTHLEEMFKNYSAVILNDVRGLLEKYMSLVKNFPLVFNSSKLKQNIDQLISKLNTDSVNNYLNTAVQHLIDIHTALLTYTYKMIDAVNNSKAMQILKRMPNEANLKAYQTKTITKAINQKETQAQKQQTVEANIEQTKQEEIKNESTLNNSNQEYQNLPIQSSSSPTNSLSSSSSSESPKSSSSNVPLMTPLTSPPPPSTPMTPTNNSFKKSEIENLNKIIQIKLTENLSLIQEPNRRNISSSEEASTASSTSSSNNTTEEEEEESEDEDEEEEDSSTSTGDDEPCIHQQNLTNSTNNESNQSNLTEPNSSNNE